MKDKGTANGASVGLLRLCLLGVLRHPCCHCFDDVASDQALTIGLPALLVTTNALLQGSVHDVQHVLSALVLRQALPSPTEALVEVGVVHDHVHTRAQCSPHRVLLNGGDERLLLARGVQDVLAERHEPQVITVDANRLPGLVCCDLLTRPGALAASGQTHREDEAGLGLDGHGSSVTAIL